MSQDFCGLLPTSERGRHVLAGKLKRLGIPWLVITTLVLPALDYIHYHTQSLTTGLGPRSFGRHWWLAMARMGRFYIGPMDMSAYLDMTQHFYQCYMWFISLLLLFFVIFWMIDRILLACRHSSAPAAPHAMSAGLSVPRTLTVVAVLNVALYSLLKRSFPAR